MNIYESTRVAIAVLILLTGFPASATQKNGSVTTEIVVPGTELFRAIELPVLNGIPLIRRGPSQTFKADEAIFLRLLDVPGIKDIECSQHSEL